MLKWNWWSFYWIVLWFGLGFLGPELWALWRYPQNTLSYQVWHLEGMGLKGLAQNPLHWTFAQYAMFCGVVWLVGHFTDGLWR
jgi:hypothetical protein